jgi:NADH-quinone oxidoreductase subunit E
MERARSIEQVIERFPQAGRDSLIPILQAVQEEQGYLSEAAVVGIGRHLGIPASKVYGVATVYNQFRFQPKGKYHVLVCRGTACHVKGSAKVLEAVVKHLKIEPGKTTRDKMFSLETVACMGACALSPVICINDDFYAKVSPAKVIKLIEACREKELTQIATA